MKQKILKLSEKQIETQILTWLNLQPGIFAFKVNMTGIYDTKRKVFRKNKNQFIHLGTADIIGIAYERFLAIEVKTPQTLKQMMSKPTDTQIRQRDFLYTVRSKGGLAMAAGSLEEVIEFFTSLTRGG